MDDAPTPLATLVDASRAVAATSARSRKVALIADVLRTTTPDDVPTVVAYLSGELRQRRTGVGWASLRDVPPPATDPRLTVAAVDAAFERIASAAGAGSQATRAALLAELFAAATADEQNFLRLLAVGELRQGALDGVMTDAIAKAFGLPLADVRQAAMLRGDLPAVASVAARDGASGLAAIDLQVGRPVQPMLAQSAPSVAAAMEKLGGGRVAVEWKLDGIRVQAHRDGDRVSVFTRTLDDITDRVPEIVDAVAALDVDDVVLDGEAIALDAHGRARPFLESAARTSSRLAVDQLRAKIPLAVFVFDVLHLDGAPLLKLPGEARQRELERVVPQDLRVPRLVSDDPGAAAEFFADAISRGHEGVVVKSLSAPYEAGRRGAGWVKVKPRHTLDLVVLAAEWGHGRRRGLLSNLHLGARDPAGGFVMLGKTFKGLTDETLAWQTREFLEREASRDSYTVYLRPEMVVEIAFDGVQRSSRYPGGVALRFARVLRYRPDKTADQADLIDDVLAIHQGHHGSPAPTLQDSLSDNGQT
jgi:DNA ligase-1